MTKEELLDNLIDDFNHEPEGYRDYYLGDEDREIIIKGLNNLKHIQAPKMTVVFVLKNGIELKTKCDSIEIEKNLLGTLTGYEIKGITENKPLYIDLNQIACIYRIMPDEK